MRKSGGGKEVTLTKVDGRTPTRGDVTIERSDWAKRRIVSNLRHYQKLTPSLPNSFSNGVIVEEGAVVKSNHLLGDSLPQVTRVIPTEPLGREKCPVTQQDKPKGEKGLVDGEKGQTILNFTY